MFDVVGRIGYFMRLNSMDMTDLSKSTGITRQAIVSWFDGECIPSVKNIEIICNVFEITLKDFFNDSIEESCNLTENEKIILDKWRKLKEYKRRNIMQLIDYILEEDGDAETA